MKKVDSNISAASHHARTGSSASSPVVLTPTSPPQPQPPGSVAATTGSRATTTAHQQHQSNFSFPLVPRKPFPKALVIHPDPEKRRKIFVGLTSRRFCVTTCSSPADAFKLLKFPPSGDDFDVIFVDCDTSVVPANIKDKDQQDGTATTSPLSSSAAFAGGGLFAGMATAARDNNNNSMMRANFDGGASSSLLAASGYDDAVADEKQMTALQFVHFVRVQEFEAQRVLGKSHHQPTGGGSSSSGGGIYASARKKGDPETDQYRQGHGSSFSSSSSSPTAKSKKQPKPSEIFSMNSVVAPPAASAVGVEKVIGRDRRGRGGGGGGGAASADGGSVDNAGGGGAGDDSNDEDADMLACHGLDSFLNQHHDGNSNENRPPDIAVTGLTAQKVVAGRRTRHIIVGLCSRQGFRDQIADCAINVLSLSMERFSEKRGGTSSSILCSSAAEQQQQQQPSSPLSLSSPTTTSTTSAPVAATTTTTSAAIVSLAKAREPLSPLFDATLTYPFRNYLPKLESVFVSPEEQIANFLEKPNTTQLVSLLADVTERRVGGMVRVVSGPDWRALTEAVSLGDHEATRTLLHPIPKMVKVEKSHVTGQSGPALTIHAIDDGTNDISTTTAHALYRAHADVKRAREEVQLERDSLDATNVELEASHIRNQELVRRIEQSLEDQKRLEDEVKYYSTQLKRKEEETRQLRATTEEAVDMAKKIKESYDKLCEATVHDTAAKQKLEEENEAQLHLVRQQQQQQQQRSSSGGRRTSSPRNVVDPTARKKNPDTKSQGGRTVQANIGGRHPLPPSTSRKRSAGGGGGRFNNAAFRSGASSQFVQKQEARCVEVDIGLDSPLYLDLLADTRTRCLELLEANTALREEVFQCHSIIHDLRLEKLAAWEHSLLAHGGGGGSGALNSSNALGASMRNLFMAQGSNKQQKDFFATFRRQNRSGSFSSSAAAGGGGGRSKAASIVSSASSSAIMNNNPTSSKEEGEGDAACFVLGIATKRDNSNNSILADQKKLDDFLKGGGGGGIVVAADGDGNDDDDDEVLLMKRQATVAINRARDMVKESRRHWRQNFQRASEKYESRMMAMADALSCVTVNENVFHLIRDGVRFKTANYDYGALQEIRCRSEFSDDTVHGALVTTRSAVPQQQQQQHQAGGGGRNRTDPLATLEESISKADNKKEQQQQDQKASSPATALSITRGGTGGTAAAVIHSLIQSSQKRSQEPVRNFLRKSLEKLWINVKSVTQATMLDVMTTHSALGHGLDRLTAATAALVAASGGDQQQRAIVTAPMLPTDVIVKTDSSSSSVGSSPPVKGKSFSSALSSASSAAPAPPPPPPPSATVAAAQRQKHNQLALSLRRLFLDRLTAAMNKLFDGLAEKFSDNIYSTYYGAAQVMDDQIHTAVHPLALENARLATALLIAKTAAHRYHSKQQQRRKSTEEGDDAEGAATADGDGVSKKSSSASAAAAADVDFEKTVTTRDSWCQTRPVMIRDPIVDDIV